MPLPLIYRKKERRIKMERDKRREEESKGSKKNDMTDVSSLQMINLIVYITLS